MKVIFQQAVQFVFDMFPFVRIVRSFPGDPGPPSVSIPRSLLQARRGRVSLHVSPEMSHHFTHSHTQGFRPAAEHSTLFSGCMGGVHTQWLKKK